MTTEITLSLPLSVQVSKNKKFIMNLNHYRNAHFHTLNKAKAGFADIIAPKLKALPKFKRIKLLYTLFPGSRVLNDVANVCSIVDKFFSDCLTKHEIIEDDNYKFLTTVSYAFGSVDKTNPRVDVTIIDDDIDIESISSLSPTTLKQTTTHKQKEKTMRVTILETEIHNAIIAYINSIMSLTPGTKIDIDLRATRGEGGYTAEIDITPRDGLSEVTVGSKTFVREDDAVSVAEEPEALSMKELRKHPEPSGIFAKKPAKETESTDADADAEEETFNDVIPGTDGEAVEAESEGPAKTKKVSLFNKMKVPDNA